MPVVSVTCPEMDILNTMSKTVDLLKQETKRKNNREQRGHYNDFS